MAYETNAAEKLVREYSKVQLDMEALFIKVFQAGQRAENAQAKEQLLH